MPELIIAKIIDDGPIRGFTLTPNLWANEIISAPGSAIPGHPESDKIPIEIPLKHGSR